MAGVDGMPVSGHNRDDATANAYRWLTASGYTVDLRELRALADECLPSRGSFTSYWQRIAARWVDAGPTRR